MTLMPISNNDIVVTGMGIVSALGYGKDVTWKALRTNCSGIRTIRFLKTIHQDLPSGEVPYSNSQMRDMLQIRDSKIITRSPLLGMLAAKEAVEQARLQELTLKMAFVNGTTVGGMDLSEQYYSTFLSDDCAGEYANLHGCGTGTEQIADYIGHCDKITTISTACSSALNAIIVGAEMLQNNSADIVVAGGCECLSKFHLNGFHSLMILDEKPCRPFDRDRQGLNLGEGAAFLVLEKYATAQKRGINPLCRLSGYGNRCDAYHQTASSPNGEGAYLAMNEALHNANLQPSDIDYINAHGTATPNNDLAESIAVSRVFGKQHPLISSTKAFTGHTTSAAGSIESVICILALQHQAAPANLNFINPIPEAPVIPIRHYTETPLKHVMNNSFGFGGNDSSCIFSRFEL